ncbi:MAG: Crp/Fnr family transcriptional regulator [Chloroflexi bacterium]|nr:Crp/Fnr family transcriptional regulator [Chloroflexota bacterium]
MKANSESGDGREGLMISLLEDSPLFKALSPKERQAVAPLFHLRTVRQGSFLFHEGDPADRLYLVAEGEVKVLKHSLGGQEVILHLASHGDLIGGIAILGEQQYPATAQAQTDVRVASLTGQDFWQLMRTYPDMAANIITILLSRLRQAHETIHQMAFERVERRLARLLLRMVTRFGERTGEGVLINIVLTRHDLAAMTGTTLESASRVMSKWHKQGLVESRHRKILIRKPHGFVEIAEDLPGQSSSAGHNP